MSLSQRILPYGPDLYKECFSLPVVAHVVVKQGKVAKTGPIIGMLRSVHFRRYSHAWLLSVAASAKDGGP